MTGGERSSRVRVTIEYLNSPEQKPLVMEYDHALLRQERGLHMVIDPSAHTFGQYADIQANGHHRASILLWSGCASYHAFKPKTEGGPLTPEPSGNP